MEGGYPWTGGEHEAPDALVQAGGARFLAHARVLAAHSGFFHSALTARASSSTGGVLVVPDLTAQQFWPLLAHMYTGHLELCAENIYQILLAAHLLRAPRALRLCQAFLAAHCRPRPVKPVASRVLPPRLLAALTVPVVPPPLEPVQEVNPSSPVIEHHDSDCSDSVDVVTTPECPNIPSPRPPTPVLPKRSRRKSSSSPAASKEDRPSTSSSAVIDVACCDGPVRFHRVLNGAYEEGSGPGPSGQNSDAYIEVEEAEEETAPYDNCNAFSKSLQRQMSENIRRDLAPDENNPNGEEASYSCAYCNHTFKSQYCYQKHALRHLNPVTMDAAEGEARRPRREVRQLDMNVQYYPCKTCGCKFPSYYFVHKHRKLCHAGEEAPAAAAAPAAAGSASAGQSAAQKPSSPRSSE